MIRQLSSYQPSAVRYTRDAPLCSLQARDIHECAVRWPNEQRFRWGVSTSCALPDERDEAPANRLAVLLVTAEDALFADDARHLEHRPERNDSCIRDRERGAEQSAARIGCSHQISD